MAYQGYVRFPHILHNLIVFSSEDDLWVVSTEGGHAERLTAGVGEVSYPRFSPDGKWIAFVGREEGPEEVYAMPADGGSAQRLTYNSASCRVLGWTPDGEEILFTSNAAQFASRFEVIYAIRPSGGQARVLPYGLANAISYGPQGAIVIGRNINDYARWKRYRGGTAGHLWCDTTGDGTFQRLLNLRGNIADPCWIGERIYFLSDHEGIGNIYSCTPQGQDLRQHTTHEDFYARHLSSDGKRLVYQAGANLHLYDPASDKTRRLSLELASQHTQRNRKFVPAGTFLDTYALHPQGYAVALTTRGKAFSMGNWEGPVIQYGERDGVRYRFLEWLNDGKRLVAISDALGRETLVVFHPEETVEEDILTEIEIGRVVDLKISPTSDLVALANHRNELLLVDLEQRTARVLDHSNANTINGISWSPDGAWLAYGFPLSMRQTAIKLCSVENGETHFATRPVLHDVAPSFDPDGKYLYFLGHRIFNPIYDNLQFDLSFPRGVKPYVILLNRNQRSPFMPEPKAPGSKEKEKDEESKKQSSANMDQNSEEQKQHTTKTQIDLEGITSRVLPFPVEEGRYEAVHGISGKVFFLSFPLEGSIHESPFSQEPPKGNISYYDFENNKSEKLLDGVQDFSIGRDNKTMIYHSHHRLRVLKAGEKPKPEQGDRPSRDSGWLNLHRLKVSVQPIAEWRQMFAEAWRLQREQFWVEDMSGIDWEAIYKQYAPLVERVGSRAELSDLLWELQGELGTSHAYEIGGEYRHRPYYRQGFLGVDWMYDAAADRYRIARIIEGDPSNSDTTSPLTAPGLNITVGDALLAINGQRVTKGKGPQELLVNQAGNELQLLLEQVDSKEVRTVVVKALSDERPARYREWVEENRRKVHEISQDRVGYIHVPNMMGEGFAEFHRGYLTEYDYPALLIDVRWNGGGHVSGLLLEKLARKRIGYDFSRWNQPQPYPAESPQGPMVALTNEHAGSDGDIFSHSFKLMGLGPLVGKRTWGGVIGINPRHKLVDGTVTTQPEYSFWFKDVGWNVENYGTDPDIEVDIAPQDFVHQVDPQLDRAIAEALRLIEEKPSLEPRPGERPRLGRK